MSTYLDHASTMSPRFYRPVYRPEIRRGGADWPAVRHLALMESGRTKEANGLSDEASGCAFPLWASNDHGDAYFEIYSVSASGKRCSSFESTQWRWRLRMTDGGVLASSDVYANPKDCFEAVSALRQSAGAAEIRHIE